MTSKKFTQEKAVQLESEEFILFQGYPSQINIFNLSLLLGMFVNYLFVKNGAIGQTSYIILFLLLYCRFFAYRLTITSHKAVLQYPFGILTQQVKRKNLAKTPYLIQPSKHSNLIRKWLKLKNNDVFSRNTSIKFVETPYANSTILTRLNILFVPMFNQQNQRQISHALKEYWQFDPELIVYEAPYNFGSEQHMQRQQHDIGKSCIYLLLLAVLLGIGGVFIPFAGVHFGIESYLGLLPAGCIAFALCYAVIRTENKKYPLATALVSSILLGASFYALGLQANRWYSESRPNHAQTHLLKLTKIDKRYQTWQLTPELQEKTGLNEIYINEKWAGFNRNLKLGQSYPVTIHKGYFQDYWIQDDTFQQLKLAQESQP